MRVDRRGGAGRRWGTGGIVVAPADAFSLHVERTGAAQHVGGVLVLDPTDQRPTMDEVRKLVAGGFARLPRMHQRPAQVSRWRRLRWIEAEHVDLDWHVLERHSPDGQDGLLRLVGDLAERPMPRDRPLWRIAAVADHLRERLSRLEGADGRGQTWKVC